MRASMCAAMAFAIGLLGAPPSHAGFVNGVETFDGTQLDTNTWEFFELNPGQAGVSQNDKLILAGVNGEFSPGVPKVSDADYTTRAAVVNRGDAVRVDALLLKSIPSSDDTYTIFLTDNSKGTTEITVFDSQFLALRVTERTPINTFRGGNGGGAGRVMLGLDGNFVLGQVEGTENRSYEIAYLNSNSARFSAFNETGLLGSTTLHFDEPLPKSLAISLSVNAGASVEFDNVKVRTIPLPLAAWSGGSVMLGLFGINRWRSWRVA